MKIVIQGTSNEPRVLVAKLVKDLVSTAMNCFIGVDISPEAEGPTPNADAANIAIIVPPPIIELPPLPKQLSDAEADRPVFNFEELRARADLTVKQKSRSYVADALEFAPALIRLIDDRRTTSRQNDDYEKLRNKYDALLVENGRLANLVATGSPDPDAEIKHRFPQRVCQCGDIDSRHEEKNPYPCRMCGCRGFRTVTP